MTFCMLLTRLPANDEEAERVFRLSIKARKDGTSAHFYLVGDGVLCARNGLKTVSGVLLRKSISSGTVVRASAKDLRARGIVKERIENGVEIIEDFEDVFIDDMMERSGGVVSW